jgi:hypothetical protein
VGPLAVHHCMGHGAPAVQASSADVVPQRVLPAVGPGAPQHTLHMDAWAVHCTALSAPHPAAPHCTPPSGPPAAAPASCAVAPAPSAAEAATPAAASPRPAPAAPARKLCSCGVASPPPCGHSGGPPVLLLQAAAARFLPLALTFLNAALPRSLASCRAGRLE